MMMMMRELVSILLHTRIQTRARPQEESKSSESTTESPKPKISIASRDDDEKERKTTTPRAHNPSRKDVNARIKRARIRFDHFHARLSDRSTRTARISNAKPSFFYTEETIIFPLNRTRVQKLLRERKKKVYKYDDTRT